MSTLFTTTSFYLFTCYQYQKEGQMSPHLATPKNKKSDDNIFSLIACLPYRWPFRSWDENFTKILKHILIPPKPFNFHS